MIVTMRPILFLLLLIVISFSLANYGCKKDEDKMIPLDTAVKKAYSFRPGTYWVFKDSISNRYDSFVVTDNTDYFSGTGNIKYEQVEMHIAQYSSDTPNNLMAIFLENERQVRVVYTYFSDSSDRYKNYSYAPVPYPFTAGIYYNGSTSPFNDTVTVSLIPNLTAGGTAFPNAAALSFQNSYTRFPGGSFWQWQYRDAFYMNDSVGFLRISLKHIPEGIYKEWNLARWHVVR